MKRKTKMLVAMLAMCMALAAVGAQGAAAAFTAASYPVTLSGSQPEGNRHKFMVMGGTVECETATFVGQMSMSSPWQTITPNYSGCKAFGLNATVTMNGCDYFLWASGSVNIECSGGKTITIDTAANLCNTHIGGQSFVSWMTYTNNGNHVDVDANLSLLHAVVTGTIFCPVATSTSTTGIASYQGTTTLKGNGGSTKIDVN